MRFVVLLIAAITLAACGTRYQEMGLTGGVEAQQIDDRTARISARGNGYTDAATVRDYTLLKAAETTLASGFQYFSVLGSDDASRTGSVVIPGQSTTSVSGGYGYATASTTYTPAQMVNFIKPGQDAYIRMYSLNEVSPEARAALFDAAQVRKHLGARYISDG